MFLNEVYKATDPQNEAVYSVQEVGNKAIYESVIAKNECLNEKSEVAFATWCSKRKAAFMGVPFSRKRTRGSNKRYRKLYVMKDKFREDIVEAITTSIPRYQNYINSSKKIKKSFKSLNVLEALPYFIDH